MQVMQLSRIPVFKVSIPSIRLILEILQILTWNGKSSQERKEEKKKGKGYQASKEEKKEKKKRGKGIMLAFRTKVPAAKSRYTFVTGTTLNIL